MQQLFEQPPDPQAATAHGRVVGLVVGANVWGTFDYSWPAALGEPFLGQRVQAPFGKGNRKITGVVVEPDRAPGARANLKAVAAVLDQASQFDDVLWKLGAWISHYYMTPPGMVLTAMVPSAVGRHAPRTEAVAFLGAEAGDWPGGLGPRQKRILDELIEARKQGIEPLTVEQLLTHSGSNRETLSRLVQRGLVRTEARELRLGEPAGHDAAPPFELNEDQAAALTALEAKLAGGFSTTLLHGVTGSGKTEVYVRAIRQVAAAGRQTILLVPEIALATQTLARLVARLPRVAVLHSGLTDAQRAHYYQQIRDGHAAVVVGPRSAIFAPCRKLGLIIVDEEHEPTYKQDTAPRYHGRDTAVMRGSLAGVPVILGSATPSLESLHNANLGRYALLRLPRRVRGLPMPALQVVSLRQEMTPGRIELLGKTLTHAMATALDRREQIILLMNRRGYASYVFCPKPSCGWIMECDHCSRAMVFHQATDTVLCHYCQHGAALPHHCPACSGKLLLFGLGIQRIEGELARKFPAARAARMDSDTMTSPAQFQKVFSAFAARELDILLGTQMVGKGLDFPGVSLVGVVSADTSLAISDFRSSERTFQLIVQVAGRAGRADLPGKVVVQTLHPEEPAIKLAATHDYDGFAAKELPLREETHLPPFTRMVRILIRHSDGLKAQQGGELLAARLRKLLPAAVTMSGPQAAEIKKIKNEMRFHILLSAPRAGMIQDAIAGRLGDLCRDIAADVVADVDPVNLL
ncbi:MAG: primosomal protein N' [Planctomycetaceae bacterium]|nr:primosomal protein N' [Planctomycetaceae bacterium]